MENEITMKWKDICDCDVEDKERLAIFRAKLKTWKNCLNSQDVHSISQQITRLLWYDTVYRTYNEAVGLSNETNDPSTGVSATMWELLDLQFMDMQVMAIRRLTDPHEHDPGRTVCSLPRLICEIKENIELYTRENYVCYDGISYGGSPTDQWKEQVECETRHVNYDTLSQTGKTERSRNDKVNLTVFENKLKKEFKTFEVLRKYANKYLAHASDPKNRGKVSVPDQVTLSKFDDSYKAIFHIGKIIGLLIDEFSPCEVPTPQFDQLKNWNKPIITPEDHTKLYDYWQKRVAQIKNWDNKIHP